MDQHQVGRSSARYPWGTPRDVQTVVASAEILAGGTDLARPRAIQHLCEGFYSIAWAQSGRSSFRRAFFRRGWLAEFDREDVCQEAVVAAFRAWHSYQPERGSIEAWVHAILVHEAHAWVRLGRRAKRGGAYRIESGRDIDALPGPVEEGGDPVAHVLQPLSGKERRIVELHDVVGLSFPDIGELEGISSSEANRIHMKARETMTRARKHWCLPPLPVLADRPSRDQLARAWARVVAEGLGDLPSASPASGVRLRPSSRPPVSLGRVTRSGAQALVRLVAGALIGGLAFCGDALKAGRAQNTAADAATVLAAEGAASGEPATNAPSLPPAVSVSSLPDVESPPVSARPPGARLDPEAELRVERALVDAARVLVRGAPTAAIAAALDLQRRFPRGQSAAAEDKIIKDACAQLGALASAQPACPRR